MSVYIDAAGLEEDSRIELIGKTVMSSHSKTTDAPMKPIGFVVENDEKADRYIAKLKAKFPQIRVLKRTPAPGNTVLVSLAGPLN